MMNYGFAIDTASCIGCHACSTACKSENEVPLGVYRTWVKATEVGAFPDVRRTFQVTRCNHCRDAPCVTICPTTAMHTREDGIVDFDNDACIGCKACMQACPYDAIHLDPATKTAAKCHYCAHRVEVGMEPACVVVCPEHAILAGDLDDPQSEISRAIAKKDVVVRKPEKGTEPKLFYFQGDQRALRTDLSSSGAMYQATDKRQIGSEAVPGMGGQVSYNVEHDAHWHWPIPAYLVTKYIAGGLYLLLAILALRPRAAAGEFPFLVAGGVGLAATWITFALLVYDLDRPDRFLYLLSRPQWGSWVARAAWLLTAFAVVTHLWWLIDLAVWLGVPVPFPGTLIIKLLAIVALPLAWGVAVYTAFLFAQAKGRDLWQSGHLAAQMTCHALALGGWSLLTLLPLVSLPPLARTLAVTSAVVGGVGGLMVGLLGDVGMPHTTDNGRRARHDMVWGRYRLAYWGGGVVAGHLVPLAVLFGEFTLATPIAFACCGIGLFLQSWGLVMAPQRIANA